MENSVEQDGKTGLALTVNEKVQCALLLVGAEDEDRLAMIQGELAITLFTIYQSIRRSRPTRAQFSLYARTLYDLHKFRMGKVGRKVRFDQRRMSSTVWTSHPEGITSV